MRGVSIHYGDVAPEAKENFVPKSNDSKFDTLPQLQKYNLNFPNYANPCELYSVILDGTASAFPSVPEQANLGLWSEQISNDDGTFSEPVVLELESVGQYTSQGLTLTFDTYNQIYATRLSIKWLRITDEGITPIAEQEFMPDSAFYFCRKFVENYNKVVITFYSINMPKNRLKLRVIDYGYGTVFKGNELRNVKLIQELDPISTQISINTADFTLDNKTDMEYSFQAKQPLSIYFNDNLRTVAFVKNSTRKSASIWDVQSEDYIGIMDKTPYYGDIYNGVDAYELLEDIFAVAKVPYTINESLKGVLLYGHIPYTTCRNAVMQVAFAVQNVVDTSNRVDVGVFELSDDVTQEIPLERIMQGQNFGDAETVSAVDITAHTYQPTLEELTVYSAEESGIGEHIIVVFSDPVFSLSIKNGVIATDANGKELKSANYAVITANEGCVLKGYKYNHITTTRRKQNPLMLASELENVVSITDATLISSHNVNMVLNKCFAWISKTNTTNLKIIEGKHVKEGGIIKFGKRKFGTVKFGQRIPSEITYDKPVNLGDTITAATEYLGTVTGKIVKQTFNLSGNIIVKDTVLK